ncbi:hypothetical protein KC19_7G154300 [Ceratodon purpureus]|uniref:Uncharacterized protein n=1 Tax=Ceratodon purpureus TaxID=3225 RepID=A0A8T0H8E4_CERPU|nr:hypothetical protein KC19_7G154300 [Ceratodon purpureus]
MPASATAFKLTRESLRPVFSFIAGPASTSAPAAPPSARTSAQETTPGQAASTAALILLTYFSFRIPTWLCDSFSEGPSFVDSSKKEPSQPLKQSWKT